MPSSSIARFKEVLRRVPWLYGLVQRAYRKMLPPPEPIERVVAKALGSVSDAFFVQVGSNDGAQGDPIHRLIRRNSAWHGIFIEPVPHVFGRLRANYGNEARFSFENVAIGKHEGTATFYYVSDRAKLEIGDQLPYWYDQLGSFDRAHILKHLDGQLEPYIVKTELACLPLRVVLERNQVHRVDLLHIDTEGYDYQVLLQVDFARYRPKVVLYEHTHLSSTDQESAHALLVANGYGLRRIGGDTLAVFST